MTATTNKISDTESCSSQLCRDKRTYSVPEIVEILQISKSKAYELCKESHFRVIRLGRTVKISKSSFDDWLNNL